MNLGKKMRALVATMAVVGICGVASTANAMSLLPFDPLNVPGTTNFISLNDILSREFDVDIGDLSAPGVDVAFRIEATEDLGTVSTSSPNPLVGGISNLQLEWNTAFDGSGVTLGTPLDVTDAAGNLLFSSLGGLALNFISGTSAFLLVSADAVLRNGTNFDVRVEAVPIPPAAILFGSALIGMGFLSRRRRRRLNSNVTIA